MLKFSPEGRVCSFCGTQGGKHSQFSGGMGAMICPACVDRFHEINHSEAGISDYQQPPWENVTQEELLEGFQTILRTCDQADEFARAWVELMKGRRISWARIGRVLGVTRQAAWERYSRPRGAPVSRPDYDTA